MIISAVYSLRNSIHRIARSARNYVLLIVLAVLLAGCIQPDAPLPGAATVTPPIRPLPTSANAAPVASAALAATPIPAASANATFPPEANRVWQQVPIGPEQVAILFYSDATGSRCVRSIFRSQVTSKCATAGQTLVAVTGVEQAADAKMYTIIAGRVLTSAITAVSVEMADGSNQPAQVSDEGFAVVLSGTLKAVRAIPVDQHGNLVGSMFSF